MFFDLITIWSYDNRMVLGTSVSCGYFHIKGVYEFPMIATCALIIDMRFLNNILMYFILFSHDIYYRLRIAQLIATCIPNSLASTNMAQS